MIDRVIDAAHVASIVLFAVVFSDALMWRIFQNRMDADHQRIFAVDWSRVLIWFLLPIGIFIFSYVGIPHLSVWGTVATLASAMNSWRISRSV